MAKTFDCSEVWGGNKAIDEKIILDGLEGSLYCLPVDKKEGGDLYFLSLCGRATVSRIVVVDAMGHDQVARNLSGEILQLLQENMNETNAGKLLSNLNRSLSHFWNGNKFATAACLTHNNRTGELHYAYAGHPPSLKYEVRSEKWLRLGQEASARIENIPLGVLDTTTFLQSDSRLEKGDLLLIYTDGLMEMRDENGEYFGEKSLVQTLQGLNGSSHYRKKIMRTLKKFGGRDGMEDDLTLLILQKS